MQSIREPAGTLNSMTTGGKSYYYLTDATGNVLGLVDDTGKRTHTYAYGPTGLPRGTTTEAVPQPYRYAGAYLDPTGLYKMGHRYYDPTLGRFTQPDPSGQETNPYLYAAGDPINHTDPSGLSSWSVGLDACFWVCLGGGYSKDDSGNSGGYVKIGVGLPGVGGGFEGSTGGADAGPSAYGGCAAGLGTVGGQIGGQDGSPTASASGGIGTYASTPMCSGGLQIQL
ncbi:RHS repeat-associated core domain-containing protein [Streptomyces althioticus]|uniref:RHS repeat-associated core domain-containing protein n=1 Tax=Streptomyces althioticus TaxID=83380 RepID=UPI003825E35E